MSKTISTICHLCNNGCGMQVWLENDRIVKVEGDPNHPVSLGGLCPKGLAAVQLEYDDKRILHPLRRKGARGEGHWQQISLDEAIDIAAHNLVKIKEKYGASSIAYYIGSAPGWDTNFQYVQRFANFLGSPNIGGPANLCHSPGTIAALSVYGGRTIPDFEHANLVLLWGFNPGSSLQGYARRILNSKERGAKLVVVSSAFSGFASKADLFVQPRPGTDGALALGMMHVIIDEALYDSDFVQKWTIGFDQLKELVTGYTPNTVEEITWVPSNKIIELARTYATTKPACMHTGNGLDGHTNVVQTYRSIDMLQALTGNLGLPGGDIFSPELKFTDILAQERLPREIKSVAKYPLLHKTKRLCMPEIQDSIFSEEPYAIKAMIVQGGCPVVGNADSRRTKEALRKLDFLVIHEMFMTATAEFADIIIPAATFFEQDYLFKYQGRRKPALDNLFGLQKKIIDPLGESISNEGFRSRLAQAMGLSEYFPWRDIKECINEELQPFNLSYRELEERGVCLVKTSDKDLYQTYEKIGFNTPSGKVELYSSTFKQYGYDPLPEFIEPAESPYSRPNLFEQYPLICGAGTKRVLWTNTQFRTLNYLTKIEPESFVEIHPQKAAELGINDGEYVVVESVRGSIRMKVKVTKATLPNVVFITPGWGQPYVNSEDMIVNLLTEDSNRCPISGATGIRSFLCRIKKR